LNESDARMSKSVESLKHDLQSLRTGKATPALLESVRVDAYGSTMPLSQVASITAPQPRLLVVQPWDKGLLQDVMKGIQKADLGLNPADDGELIRVPIPALTEERRKEMVKKAKKQGEDAKVSIRNIRRDANEEIKKLEKDSVLSEDESRRLQGEIQKITDKHTAQIDEVLTKKEKEILEV
ncbi:MAG: ribosome recycling factor, partial [Candidatus Eisenbacteria bacterium]|nr:ribosome recycling factor [Candidatus Eisenbacteria bacterium]